MVYWTIQTLRAIHNLTGMMELWDYVDTIMKTVTWVSLVLFYIFFLFETNFKNIFRLSLLKHPLNKNFISLDHKIKGLVIIGAGCLLY